MTINEGLELEARIFELMTGHMAPFKDSPAAAGPTDMVERAKHWWAWRAQFEGLLKAMHVAIDEMLD